MKTRATIDDLYKVEGKAELVHGEIVKMPPSEKSGSDSNETIIGRNSHIGNYITLALP